MIRYIKADTIGDKTYLYRGVSNNKYQSNYSQKHHTRFTSRFYAYELFDGIQLFGNVAVYELNPSARIFDYEDCVEQFVEDYDLQEFEFPELFEIYKIHSLSELKEYGGDVTVDYHDLYHARQLVAIAYCEDNLSDQYDGILWYDSIDTPEYQTMIWNSGVVRRLSYQEAKSVLLQMEQIQKDMGITDTLYHKDEFDGKYNYGIAKKNQGNY